MRALIIFLLTVSVFATGCGRKRTDRGQVRIGRGAGQQIAQTGQGGTPQPGQPFQRVFGDIFGFAENNVKALVSATIDVEDETQFQAPVQGIGFSGDIKLSGSTQNVLALGSTSASIASGSELAIFIIDNLTVTENLEAITIGFKPGSSTGYSVSGQISNGGIVQMTFSDQFGDIILNGRYNVNDFTGEISFRNKGGMAPNQLLRLGDFKVPTCGFFHCQ